MRALFLSPGTAARQLQLFPAVAAVADQLQAQVQVACPPDGAAWWSLHPAVEKTIPFAFEGANLADWANLLGSVREPDFQLVVNLASGRQVDLMLAMSHIPTRVAAGGFSATTTVTPPNGDAWPAQALEAYLGPIGVRLDANSFRLALPQADLEAGQQALPAGDGPLLLLARSGAANDWPAAAWGALPGTIRSRLASLRVIETNAAAPGGAPRQIAARLAGADVVLASDPVSVELALLLGLPLVALGPATPLPQRSGVQQVGEAGALAGVSSDAVLTALGFG